MNRHVIWLILLGLLIVQGSLLVWILPSSWQSNVYVTPHLMLVFILFIGLFHHRHAALIYGLVFGLLHDFTYYGAMLGVYSFGMGLTGYLAGLVQRRQPNLIFYNLVITAVGLFLFECINYGINRLFKLITVDFQFALTHYMLPTVLFNLLIALICYVPIRKLLEGRRKISAAGEE
ncbi:rod shape-determining protein MreD [Paenibacillus oryzisoli]|uniref:rod shape-determining protein MreD n=1 Tax=Paenibacillus oryzisoli TaxID=1850517 RepID=UPI003D2D8E3B